MSKSSISTVCSSIPSPLSVLVEGEEASNCLRVRVRGGVELPEDRGGVELPGRREDSDTNFAWWKVSEQWKLLEERN